MSLRIAYWNNLPSPYFIDRLNALNRIEDVEVFGIFSDGDRADRKWEGQQTRAEFEFAILSEQDAAPVPALIDIAKSQKPDLVIGLYSDRTYMEGILRLKAMGIPYVIRFMPSFEAWFPKSRSREAAKHLLFRSVLGAVVTSNDAVETAMSYGFKADQLCVAPQSISLDFFTPGEHTNSAAHPPRIGYVGRYLKKKGLGDLFAACEHLSATGFEGELHLAGFGDDFDIPSAAAACSLNVVDHGHLEGNDLVDFYRSLTALAFPTLGDPHGLVATEALACGVPVVSTSSAGGIEARVLNGYNGRVVSPSSPGELALALAATMDEIDQIKPNCRPSVLTLTHERWASTVEGHCRTLLGKE